MMQPFFNCPFYLLKAHGFHREQSFFCMYLFESLYNTPSLFVLNFYLFLFSYMCHRRRFYFLLDSLPQVVLAFNSDICQGKEQDNFSLRDPKEMVDMHTEIIQQIISLGILDVISFGLLQYSWFSTCCLQCSALPGALKCYIKYVQR